jgi:Alr-MurF fusion protein
MQSSPTMQQPVYPASAIARITGGKLLSNGDAESIVHHLIIDSRKIVTGRHDVFFALISPRNNGHRYISELIEKGVETFVVSRMPEPDQLNSGSCFVLVDDTLAALQSLAAYHRSRFSIPVIGITGSNGKTIVKEWLWQLIGSSRNLVRSPKSYNSQIGVPLSVWQMTSGDELGIFEAGISQPDEMYKLEKIIKPTIGIFTNIGPAHNENFTSRLHKASEKLGLFRHCPELICCADHQDIMLAYHQAEWEEKPALITWSTQSAADLRVVDITRHDNHSHLKAIYKNKTIEISFPFGDDASVENMICCWLTMLHLGFSNEMIATNAATLHPVAMRLTLKEGSNNCSLIDDTYSSDLASLSIALNFLKQQNQHRSKAVILSDLLQSGKPEIELYAEIAALVASHHISRFIGVGAGMIRHKNLFNSTATFYSDTEELLNKIPELDFQNESILIKGARVFGFERIVQILQQKTHETVLEVNLDALVHNLNYYKSKLNTSTRIMAMVKAFSYGSGSFEIANILQFRRVDYLAVAYADEGIELRKAGIKLPIMVMNPEEQGFEGMFTFELEPEIYNLRSLHLLLQAMKRYGRPENKTFRIHLKLDTGMHRLGFSEEELPELAQQLEQTNLLVASAFSHLAASDDPAHDVFTELQISAFKRMSAYLEAQLGYNFLKHILNSAGISRFPAAHFDMVRLGIGLYGISSLPEESYRLEHVSSLKSTISQIKIIKAGATIGYNRNFTAPHEIKMAIIPVGYADGLSRNLSNGGYSLLVNGREAPIIGNISMDMCTIDVSGTDAREGDEVIIFSPAYPITRLAHAMKTIPYEVLTSISRRVKGFTIRNK